MHEFLKTHPNSDYGIRLWAENNLKNNSIVSMPLYSIVTIAEQDQINAIEDMLK
jgi:hypothetical protein